jgi:hypothetical protein
LNDRRIDLALSKKKSRPIVVDGVAYRWHFREDFEWNDIVVRAVGPTGQRLVIRVPWSNSEPPHLNFMPSVTPKWVANAIRHCLEEGWQPHVRASNYELTVPFEKFAPEASTGTP